MRYLIIAALLLTACVNTSKPIYSGMDKAQVQQAWGSPTSRRTSNLGSTWVYKEYYGRTLGSKWNFVHFNQSGKVIYWSKGSL